MKSISPQRDPLTPATTTPPAGEPPAASLAFVSQDQAVRRALVLLKAGRYRQAETLLAANPGHDGESIAREETREIIRRMRINYSLTPAKLAEKIRESIPEATDREANRWARESQARWRLVDGQKFFFRREPRNIFLFSEEAQTRRAQAGHAPAEAKWKLMDHLRAVVAEAERTGRTEVLPVYHKISHSITIPGNAPGVKAGSLVRAWLPFPQEYGPQREVKLLRAAPRPKLVSASGTEGQSRSDAAHRTVYFEKRVTNPAMPIQFSLAFEYTSFARYPHVDEAKVQPLPADWNGGCLGERPPHIVFTPAMRRQVAAIFGKEKNPLIKARKLFRWVSANFRWNAEDEYCTIPSFAKKGFATRRGDCGILNTVFITLCRLAGIPARWQSGFTTRPSEIGGGGMHDWSEIYLAPWGWVPADASTGTYGAQPSDDPRIADFYCGHLDSYRMIVNLDWGREFFPPAKSLRSEPADFQRGEVEVDGRNLYFDQWDYRTEFERA